MVYMKSSHLSELPTTSSNMYQGHSYNTSQDDMPPPYSETQNDSPSTSQYNDDYSKSSPSKEKEALVDDYQKHLNSPFSQQTPARCDSQPQSSNRSTSLYLSKIIAIPATSSSTGSPFLRSYPPALLNYNISKKSFLTFLDKLDSIAQTEILLRESNQQMFYPHGLRVEVAKLEGLARMANIPILDADGRINKRAPLLSPIESMEQVHSISGQQRRLHALQSWISHLELTSLPELDEPANILSQLSMKASERQRRKEEDKILERRADQLEKTQEHESKAMADYRKDMLKLEKERLKIERKEAGRKYDKEMAKLEEDRVKIERDFEKEVGKGKKSSRKDKEEKVMRDILWLVIRDLNSGSEVVGPKPDM